MEWNEREKYKGIFYSAGYISTPAKDWCYIDNSHITDCLELNYCVSGEEELRVNGKTYSFLPGMVKLTPPSTRIKENAMLRTLKPSSFILAGFITEAPFVTETIILDTRNNPKIYGFFEKLVKTDSDKDNFKFFERTSVLFLLIRELQKYMNSESDSIVELDKKLKPAMDFIYEHYCEKDFVLYNLWQLCGMKEKTFYNLFKKRYNMTPSEYVTDLRMQLAIDLLIARELSISDIADKTGYESVAYFSRVFKKHFEMAPSKYIK